ncbi:MAG: bifunctional non-ous end joining protein LigD [Alphaproteobacteria bacterium]|nr:bifunctional non-ous end joining protein LigD [Alphaproteobacteria bacterium]
MSGRPPTVGLDWIHEIKHDGYRFMARRDSVGIRLITRRGNDWSVRFPLVVEAVNHLWRDNLDEKSGGNRNLKRRPVANL